MPAIYLVLDVFCLPPLLVGNGLLIWAIYKTKRAGIWPTERCFGLRIRRPFHPFDVFGVLTQLRTLSRCTENSGEARRYLAWWYALVLGYGLSLFALLVLAAASPWLMDQAP